ncbi:MAG: hypothetical protein KGJ13_05820 [Patescibacteria group bacterium]|nr:hypothetical protein [Patescibacteria group bacterium]
MKTQSTIDLTKVHPIKTMVTGAQMQSIIDKGAHLVTRKYDGQLAAIEIGNAVILAEFMGAQISGRHYTDEDREMFSRQETGWYAAITVAEFNSKDVLNESTSARWQLLHAVAMLFPPNVILPDIVPDVDKCLAAGAEGVVAMAWNDPWGAMACVKLYWEGVVRVSLFNGGAQSVFIEDAETGSARGKINLHSRCDRVRIGSLLKIRGLSLTDNGKVREPRLDDDSPTSWLVKY